MPTYQQTAIGDVYRYRSRDTYGDGNSYGDIGRCREIDNVRYRNTATQTQRQRDREMETERDGDTNT